MGALHMKSPIALILRGAGPDQAKVSSIAHHIIALTLGLVSIGPFVLRQACAHTCGSIIPAAQYPVGNVRFNLRSVCTCRAPGTRFDGFSP